MPRGQKVSPHHRAAGKRTFWCGRPRFSARTSMTRRVVEKLCTKKVCVDFSAPSNASCCNHSMIYGDHIFKSMCTLAPSLIGNKRPGFEKVVFWKSLSSSVRKFLLSRGPRDLSRSREHPKVTRARACSGKLLRSHLFVGVDRLLCKLRSHLGVDVGIIRGTSRLRYRSLCISII